MRPDRFIPCVLAVAALAFAGCNKGDKKDDDSGLPERFGSTKSVVKFKRNERIRTDFASALALTPEALCNELGQYSCTDLVHPVALGAVEPYVIGLYEPLPRTGVTTPIIVERVALAGCTQRVDLDLASPGSAVIFRGIPIGGDGRITDLQAQAVTDSIETLYKRALQRRPTQQEIDHLRDFYAEVEAESSMPARDWELLSCFVVLTTLESLFY